MAVTPRDVSTLRERTGVGMMDCKKALETANGDMEKAIEILREKGLATAAKKAGRIAAEGIVYAAVDKATASGVIVEVNSETDFVAKNESFQGFVKMIGDTVLEYKPATVEALLELSVDGKTISDILKDKIFTIGENLKIRRFSRMDGHLASYIHGGGRIGVLVKFDTTPEIAATPAFAEMAKDVAMQIAAANPFYLNKESVPAEDVEKEKSIFTTQAQNEGKPANVIEKMITGRIAKFFKETCLVDQAFIKDMDISVTQYINNVAKSLGGTIQIAAFERYEKGEGLQKKEDNFADEVASMLKQ